MFKESFKYYKSKSPAPHFDDVVDFDAASLPAETVCQLNFDKWCHYHVDDGALPPGIRPLNTWRCYSIHEPAGLIVIRNPFSTQGQRYWMARCMRDYPRHPNVVNLNANLFPPSVLEDWWRELQQCSDKDEARRMRLSMRWTTLGYHHDWNTKVYNEEMRGIFPDDLAKMCNFFATVLGFRDFTSQAAIVNFYPIGTTLAGHTDHSEVNLQAPLFSFSFGQTAIFLIGGKSKDDKPTALFLRSGDLLVMSGESRLCYHAVPRVLKARDELWNDLIIGNQRNSLEMENPNKKLRTEYEYEQPSEWEVDTSLYKQVADEVFWEPFKKYLNDSRINVNVRQVLEPGGEHLPSPWQIQTDSSSVMHDS